MTRDWEQRQKAGPGGSVLDSKKPHLLVLTHKATQPGNPGVCFDLMEDLAVFTYDFSIWYCPHDDNIASCISMMLKKQGLRGYAEHQDQVAGTSILMTATEVIQASRVAIVILSASSLDSPWCQRVVEWNLHHVIMEEGTKMIPVYVDVEKEQVPLVLRHLNELNYRNKFFERRLLDTLCLNFFPSVKWV
uniref:TIR domain-containing protein n=1 Tax=Chelydra serpentina TaxID=8475 RepID=A0A8C3RY56_CHESE